MKANREPHRNDRDLSGWSYHVWRTGSQPTLIGLVMARGYADAVRKAAASFGPDVQVYLPPWAAARRQPGAADLPPAAAQRPGTTPTS
jgi:hypothetical protein